MQKLLVFIYHHKIMEQENEIKIVLKEKKQRKNSKNPHDKKTLIYKYTCIKMS